MRRFIGWIVLLVALVVLILVGILPRLLKAAVWFLAVAVVAILVGLATWLLSGGK